MTVTAHLDCPILLNRGTIWRHHQLLDPIFKLQDQRRHPPLQQLMNFETRRRLLLAHVKVSWVSVDVCCRPPPRYVMLLQTYP